MTEKNIGGLSDYVVLKKEQDFLQEVSIIR